MENHTAVTFLYSAACEKMAAVVLALARCHFAITSQCIDDWLDNHHETLCDAFVVMFRDGITDYPLIDSLLLTGRPVVEIKRGRPDNPKDPARPDLHRVGWPCDEKTLKNMINTAVRQARGAPRECNSLAQEFSGLDLLGQSRAFFHTIKLAKRFANSRAPILIEGETGTGKELVARALHYLSCRRDKPFVPMNCAAYPDSLFDNELFGHEKGAFTDARQNQQGLIALANEGSLFLDEVDSLSLKAQASLLRFLEDYKYRPLGGNRLIQGKVAVIAACNVNLQEQVEKGAFRRDLYYRLNVAKIDTPSLAQRPEDIPLLAQHFLDHYSKMYERQEKVFHPQSMQWLKARHWPGNIRELQNVIHQELLLADSHVIRIDPGRYSCDYSAPRGLQVNLGDSALDRNYRNTRQKVLDEFEIKYLHRLMTTTHGNITHAARIAQKERRSLGRLLQKHGIDRADYC